MGFYTHLQSVSFLWLLYKPLTLKPDLEASAACVCCVLGIQSLLTVSPPEFFSWSHPCLLVSAVLPGSGSLILASSLALSRSLILTFPADILSLALAPCSAPYRVSTTH